MNIPSADNERLIITHTNSPTPKEKLELAEKLQEALDTHQQIKNHEYMNVTNCRKVKVHPINNENTNNEYMNVTSSVIKDTSPLISGNSSDKQVQSVQAGAAVNKDIYTNRMFKIQPGTIILYNESKEKRLYLSSESFKTLLANPAGKVSDGNNALIRISHTQTGSSSSRCIQHVCSSETDVMGSSVYDKCTLGLSIGVPIVGGIVGLGLIGTSPLWVPILASSSVALGVMGLPIAAGSSVRTPNYSVTITLAAEWDLGVILRVDKPKLSYSSVLKSSSEELSLHIGSKLSNATFTLVTQANSSQPPQESYLKTVDIQDRPKPKHQNFLDGGVEADTQESMA